MFPLLLLEDTDDVFPKYCVCKILLTIFEFFIEVFFTLLFNELYDRIYNKSIYIFYNDIYRFSPPSLINPCLFTTQNKRLNRFLHE
jgi:hypothetical protein